MAEEDLHCPRAPSREQGGLDNWFVYSQLIVDGIEAETEGNLSISMVLHAAALAVMYAVGNGTACNICR